MKGEKVEHLKQLCAQVAKEQDLQRFNQLVGELHRELLDNREQATGGLKKETKSGSA